MGVNWDQYAQAYKAIYLALNGGNPESVPWGQYAQALKAIHNVLITELETLMKLDGSRPMNFGHSSLEFTEINYAETYYPLVNPLSSIGTRFVFWKGGIYAYEPDYNVPAVVLYKTEDGAPSWTNLGVIVYNQATYGGLCFTTYGEGDVIFDPFGIIQMKKDIEIAAGKKFLSAVDTALGYKANGVAGVDGSFSTADGKTVTVTKGIITSIF